MNIKSYKRINCDCLLETVHMTSKKSFKGLTKKAIMEAFPDLIEEGN